MQFRKCSRLNNDAWQSACHAGVALNRPTHRGCRTGAHKHRRMSLKRTGSNTSNLLTIRPKPDNQMMPAKLALINARSVRNKADTLHLFYLTSALRLIRLITASFSRNYTESACVVTHFAGCRPTSPTEHSASVLTITYLVRYGCNTEFPRAACWAPYSSLYTVLACRKCS